VDAAAVPEHCDPSQPRPPGSRSPLRMAWAIDSNGARCTDLRYRFNGSSGISAPSSARSQFLTGSQSVEPYWRASHSRRSRLGPHPPSNCGCQHHAAVLSGEMPPLDSLKQWFNRDIRQVTWREVDTIVDQPSVAEIRSSTKSFVYTITADENHGRSYLGCTCFDRQRRVTRYLPKGVVSHETWDDIAQAIHANEMIRDRPLPGRLF
jgi:hypothetical protein